MIKPGDKVILNDIKYNIQPSGANLLVEGGIYTVESIDTNSLIYKYVVNVDGIRCNLNTYDVTLLANHRCSIINDILR